MLQNIESSSERISFNHLSININDKSKMPPAVSRPFDTEEDCLMNPVKCNKGFTVAFWHSREYLSRKVVVKLF